MTQMLGVSGGTSTFNVEDDSYSSFDDMSNAIDAAQKHRVEVVAWYTAQVSCRSYKWRHYIHCYLSVICYCGYFDCLCLCTCRLNALPSRMHQI